MASLEYSFEYPELSVTESDQEDQDQEDQDQEQDHGQDQEQDQGQAHAPAQEHENILPFIRFKQRSPYDRPAPHKRKKIKGKNTVIKLKNVGAIGIFTHGILERHAILPCPGNVVVNKYNIATDSCSAVSINLLQDDPYCYDVTEEALFNFKNMIDIPAYKIFASSIKDKSNQPEISCELRLNIKELKRKSYDTTPTDIPESETRPAYTAHPNIIFIVALAGRSNGDYQMYKKINLISCTIEELKTFFKYNLTSRLDNETALEQFIINRDYSNKITTDQLLELITNADYNLNLGNVNILDLSCSVREKAVSSLRADDAGYRHTKHNIDPDFVYDKKKIGSGRKRKTRKRKTRKQ